MKKSAIFIIASLLSFSAMAQTTLVFPFKGGKEAMTGFFKDSLTISQDIVQRKLTGSAIFKFTADDKGTITKIIVYYADEALFAAPIVDALKKSNHQWVIPAHEKNHDFIIQFIVGFNQSATPVKGLQKTVYDNYKNRKPIAATDQVPLNEATLLPPVMLNYDITE